jgi:hypothetical protein
MDGTPGRSTRSAAMSIESGRRRLSDDRATGGPRSEYAMDGTFGPRPDPGMDAGSVPMSQDDEFILWRAALGVSLFRDGT